MEAGRVTGRIARVLPVLVTGMYLLLTPAAPPARELTPASPVLSVVSSPRESLPLPVHDEATCAFCQAAAFAPHTAAPAQTLAVVAGDEQRVHPSQNQHITPAGPARPPRSRAPPILRSV
jgi:hypothetical protein